jgi:hypothetical protein
LGDGTPARAVLLLVVVVIVPLGGMMPAPGF